MTERRNWIGVACPECRYLNPLFQGEDDERDISTRDPITSEMAYELGLIKAEGAPPCTNCGHEKMGKGNVRPCYPPGSILNANDLDNL